MKRVLLVMAMAIVPCCILANSLGDGLVGYWPFDGDANDYSGNGNHGVVHGASLIVGRYGSAYYFDGSSWIEVGHSGSLNVNQITISAWIKPTSWFHNPPGTGSRDGFIPVLQKGNSSSCEYEFIIDENHWVALDYFKGNWVCS